MEKTCSRCILGDTFPNIHFDKGGVCNYCHRYDQRCSKYSVNPKKKKKLRSLVEKVKSKGRGLEYDCIQGVSGGRDSTYTLYLLKQWGLNPLAVHVDNRMDSSIAVENKKMPAGNLMSTCTTTLSNGKSSKICRELFFSHRCPLSISHQITHLLQFYTI